MFTITMLVMPNPALAELSLPVPIPDTLQNAGISDLQNERSALLSKRVQLQQEIAQQKAACGHVDADDTTTVTKCTQWSNQLAANNSAYNSEITQFKTKVRAHMQTFVQQLQLQIQQDEQAFRNLGLGKRADDFEGWKKLATDAREQFKTTTLDLLFDQALEIVAKSTRQIAALNPPSANRLISDLRQLGVEDPSLFAAIRKVAATAGKPEMAAAVKEMLDRSKVAKDLILSSKELSEQPPGRIQAQLMMMVKALSWGLESPALTLLVQDIQFTTASVYNNAARQVSKYEVEVLTKLTEEQLRGLPKLSDLLMKHVAQMKQARSELVALQ